MKKLLVGLMALATISTAFARDCVVKIIQADVYDGPSIQRSGFDSNTYSERMKTEIDQMTLKALLGKGYTLKTDNSKGTYTLKVVTDHELFAPSAWVKYDFILSDNSNSIIALGSGISRSFTLDFIAENTRAFRKINEKAYKKGLEDFVDSLPACSL